MFGTRKINRMPNTRVERCGLKKKRSMKVVFSGFALLKEWRIVAFLNGRQGGVYRKSFSGSTAEKFDLVL